MMMEWILELGMIKEGAPSFIIQCKRLNSKIDKVTVKGLYADILHEGCELGFLVTSSEFSVGARNTVEARSYPIEEINKHNLNSWLKNLELPAPVLFVSRCRNCTNLI